jgi:rhomboid protease GluP
MPLTEPNPQAMILRLCAAAAPNPWYPSAWAREQGVSRDEVDPYLDQLRMAGVVHLTDWVPGHGQGYALTAEGAQLVEHPRELERFLAGKRPAPAPEPEPERRLTPFERGEAIRAALTTMPVPVISRALLFANVVVFVWGCLLCVQRGVPVSEFLFGANLFGPGRNQPAVGAILEETGAAWGIDVLLRHQWWRVLTYAFVHGGLLHLGMNMYVLLALGPLLEAMWGRARFLTMYLFSALGGGCAVVYFKPQVLVMGASGALCGMLASLIVWTLLNRNYLPPSLVSNWLRRMLVNVVLIVLISSVPGVSAMGHFAGGVVGLVTSVLLNVQRFGSGLQRGLALLGLAAVPVLCVAPLLRQAVPAAAASGRSSLVLHRNDGSRVEVQALEEAAWQAYQNQVEPLLKRAPAERTRAEIGKALDELSRQRAETTQVAEVLRHTPPLPDRDSETERQLGIKLFTAESRLFEIAARCLLRKADSTDEAYDHQRQDTVELRQQWLRTLKGAE